jgi:hypothetical protein
MLQSSCGMARRSFRNSGVAEYRGEGTIVNDTVLGIDRCTHSRGLASLRQTGQNGVAPAHGTGRRRHLA